MKEKIAQLISNNVEGIEMSDIIASIEIPPRPECAAGRWRPASLSTDTLLFKWNSKSYICSGF